MDKRGSQPYEPFRAARADVLSASSGDVELKEDKVEAWEERKEGRKPFKKGF